ncbi:MAG: DNA polymerase III subunit delta [Verrucomicrobia bacterium]|nr:DNA polymerase III subunit delta [Verrucomicrobiota bacterium]
MKASAYLFHGTDEYLVNQQAKALIGDLLPPDDQAFGLETLESQADTVDQAVAAIGRCREALGTLGFLGGKKVVWFKDVNYLSETVVGRSESTKTALAALAGTLKDGLSADTTLIVTAPKADKRFVLYKTIDRVGDIRAFDIPDQGYKGRRQAAERLVVCLKEAGLKMGETVREQFLDKVGNDTRHIVNEIAKLMTYLGERRDVSIADVTSVTSACAEAVAWDLADAYGRRKLGDSLAITRRLLFQRESPMALIGVIQGRVRDLLIYREALDRGWMQAGKSHGSFAWGRVPPSGEVLYKERFSRDPRAVHPFRASILAEQASNFAMRELRRCQRAAVSAHWQLVSSSLPQALILEMMLVRSLSK